MKGTNGIQRLIRQNHTDPTFSIERLAKLAGVSATYLRELVYREYHTHPTELVEKFRLGRACKLLCDPSIPIKEISVRVGYWNPKTFRAAFRKRYGCSPREFRDDARRSGQ